MLPDGGFAVLDSQAQELRVFAADGSHRATYGGEGEGPGEFRDGSRAGFMGVPFYPRGVEYYDRDGLVWDGAHEDDPAGYRIARQHLAGDTTLIVEARKPHLPVTREERAGAIERVQERLRAQGAATDRDWSKIPDVKPAIVNLFTSEEGNIWVRTPSASGDPTWDVFSADGTYAGTATSTGLNALPFLPPIVRGDEFWAIVIGAFDVQHVVRARITPSG